MTTPISEAELALALSNRIDEGNTHALADDPPGLRTLLDAYGQLQSLLAPPDPAFERGLRGGLGIGQTFTPRYTADAQAPVPRQHGRSGWHSWGRLVAGLSLMLVVLFGFTYFYANPSTAGQAGAPVPQETSGGPVDNFDGDPVEKPAQPDPGGQGQPQGQPRMIVQRGSLELVVADANAALAQVKALVARHDGYIESLESSRYSDTQTRVQLVLRLPAAALEPALSELRALGLYVAAERLTSDDQTASYVDLTARLKNLQATEAELQKLLAGSQQRQDEVADILEIARTISGVREQIEQLTAQKQLIEQSVALARLELTLQPESTAAPPPGFSPGAVAGDAWEDLLAVLEDIASALITIAVFSPLLLGALLLLWLARKLYRWKLAPRSQAEADDDSPQRHRDTEE